MKKLASGLHGRRRPSADRPPVHLSMWTADRNFGSDRPSRGLIRTMDQDYHLKVDEWTEFFTMDRPSHGRIRTPDQDNNFKVDKRTNF